MIDLEAKPSVKVNVQVKKQLLQFSLKDYI